MRNTFQEKKCEIEKMAFCPRQCNLARLDRIPLSNKFFHSIAPYPTSRPLFHHRNTPVAEYSNCTADSGFAAFLSALHGCHLKNWAKVFISSSAANGQSCCLAQIVGK
jgi:hypothetical protein